MKKERKMLPVARLELNAGQIDWLPRNPRQWTKEDVAKTAKSIAEDEDFLEDRPILVVPQGDKFVVFAGNLRSEGAKKQGLTEAPCVVYLPETEADLEVVKRRAMKDNGSFGKFDWDILANEWEGPFDDWGIPSWPDSVVAQEEEAKEDDFDEEKDPIVARCEKGDIWQLGEHRLMCGDSTATSDIVKLMGGSIADLLVTDPPYNVEYVGKTKDALTIQNDRMEQGDYRSFLVKAFSAANSVMKDGCPFYVWTARGHAMTDNMKALDSIGLVFRQQIVWVKNNFVLGHMDYHGKHEPCLYGWKAGAGHYFIGLRNKTTVVQDEAEIDIDKMKKEEMRELLHKIYESDVPTSAIACPRPARSEEHPTMKPVRLIGQLITNSSRPSELVLDIFGGSGTTIIAAEQLGRKCYTMELDPHYCDIILARWEKMTGRTAEKLN